MPFRPGGDPDYKRLQSTLANARVKEKDAPLYNVTRDLISGVTKNKEEIDDKISKSDKISLNQQVAGKLPVSHGGSYSDVYLPELYIISNVGPVPGADITPFQYNVVDRTVEVSGQIILEVLAAGVPARVGIQLPVPSYFEFEFQCSGIASTPTLASEVAVIVGEVGEPRRAIMEWIPTVTNARTMFFHFMYKLVDINIQTNPGTGTGGGGGGGTGGAGGRGCVNNPPSVALPNFLSDIETYTAANPGQIEISCGDNTWINGIIATLQGIDPRVGGNGKRGNTSDPSQDAISYYYDVGAPVFGSNCVYVVDIIGGHCGSNPHPVWINQTDLTIYGAWLPGPI